ELWSEVSGMLGNANEGRWICQEAGGLDSIEWASNLDERVTERAVARVDAMVARRRTCDPLQYVLGSWPFRTVELLVDRRVIIPRPETEQLAEMAIMCARKAAPERVVVDLGTGSGAIALACAAELPIEGTAVWATDVSIDAVSVACANAAGIGRAAANVRILEGSWFGALPEELMGHVDVVVSNPPYIADGDPEVDASVSAWEPHLALYSGSDGLGALRHIITEARNWLAADGCLLLEIGYRQGPEVRALLDAAGYRDVEIRRDLAGRDRFAYARR
ncbi:MAG: peptide chain release factor N(5)-glutamine methyltransferase, partial [Ilumatobacteraceae bacterium]